MIAVALMLLLVSVAGNVTLLRAYTKKSEPATFKEVGGENKGLLGKTHVLQRMYIGNTKHNGKSIWFFVCSCGANYSNKSCTTEASALDLWKEHVALFREFTPEGKAEAQTKLEKELEEFKEKCVCQHGQYGLGL